MTLKGKLFEVKEEVVYVFTFSSAYCTVFNKKLPAGIFIVLEDHIEEFCSILYYDQVVLIRRSDVISLVL